MGLESSERRQNGFERAFWWKGISRGRNKYVFSERRNIKDAPVGH